MVRRFIAVLAVLFFCLQAGAADYFHLRDNVTTRNGTAISGASVRIYDPNTTTAASDVHTSISGWSAVSWPLVTDNDGMFECYLPSGNYDINIEHTGWAASKTWDNYMVGVVATIDSLGAAHIDTLKSASDDTVHIRASDGARHGILKTNQLVLEDALGHGDDRAAIRFGSKTATENPNARVYLPYHGVFWMTRPGYNIRVPHYDAGGATFTDHSALGIGGTTGVATNWQWWEDVVMYWAFADAESTAATGLRYHDRGVIEFGRRLRPLDAAYSSADTTRCDAYQSLNIRNDRADTLSWMWGKRQGLSCIGEWGGPYGAPDYAIRLQTDIPDSNSSAGRKDAVQIQWVMTPGTRRIRYAGSSFLTMYEHDTVNYRFARDYFELRPSKEGSVNKGIRWFSSDGNTYTKMKVQDNESGFAIYTANGYISIYDDDGSDDATLDCANVTVADMFKFPVISLASSWPTDIGAGSAFMSTGDTLYIRNNADTAWNHWTKD